MKSALSHSYRHTYQVINAINTIYGLPVPGSAAMPRDAFELA